MPADIPRRIGISVVEDVVVRIGDALVAKERRRFRVTECHAKPKGRVELKIPDGRAASALGAGIGRESRGIGRENKVVDIMVS